MNKQLLVWTRQNLLGWVTKCSQETVSDSKKLELIMFSLADMCSALAFETEDERDAFEKESET